MCELATRGRNNKMLIKHVVQYDDGERHVHDLAELVQNGMGYKLLGRPVRRLRE